MTQLKFLQVIEPRPKSEVSIQAAIEWVMAPAERSEDATGLWDAMIPEMCKAVAYEFSEANPNKWSPLSESWLDEKREQGWPETIGIATGALKRAATTEADISKAKQYLIWGVNENVSGHGGLDVGDYAEDFHAARPIFQHSRKFMQRAFREAVLRWTTGLKWGK